jgi:hypothetical protein
VLGAAWLSCATPASRALDPSGPDEDAATGPSDAGVEIPDASEEGHSFSNADASAPTACTVCSTDLHQVLDCTTRQPVMTCPTDKACAPGGTCVDPCASATSNKSSVGCEYFAIDPDSRDPGWCYAAFIANTWTSPVSMTVEYAGQPLDAGNSAYLVQGSGASLQYAPLPGGVIPPNQVAIVFLADSVGSTNGPLGSPFIGSSGSTCPPGTTVAYAASDPAIHGTGRGHAFHITTSAPVVAYDIYPYGGAGSAISSATLLLPVSAWDTNYVSSSAYASEPSLQSNGNIVFVASTDHTTLTLNPVSAIAGGPGVDAGPAGVSQTFVLDRGESIQFAQESDLTGTVLSADAPVGAWGGHACMDLPATAFACDGAHQQIPPVKALGNEYAAVPYRSRGATEESVPWRVVGAADGTVLTYEPSAPAGAPAALARGQLVEFVATGPFVVKSQDALHPFYAAGHMTGGGAFSGLGDPETVNLVPPAQYLDRYVFFTDPTYAETNLVLVRAKATGGAVADVDLDCLAGPVAGWQPLGDRYEFTRVDLQHMGAPVGSCDNGRHLIQSASPFGATVWGFDKYVSYAYPAGASVKPINTVIVPPTQPPR